MVSPSAVSVAFCEDTEALEGTDDVFVGNALLCQFAVMALVLFGELSALGLLERQQGIGMVVLRINAYGGISLHHQSHGESFWSLITNRFGGHGIYILDEPEAALSPLRQLAMLSRLHELVKQKSQFIIATHSPLLLAYPNATIYELGEKGLQVVPYEETEHYKITRRFLIDHQKQLDVLLKSS